MKLKGFTIMFGLSLLSHMYGNAEGAKEKRPENNPTQIEIQKIRKNLIHASGGILGPDLLISGTGWYERLIFPKKEVTAITLFARIGWREGRSWGFSTIREPLAQVGILTGKKNLHFECAVGGAPESLSEIPGIEVLQPVSVSAGFRYQDFRKPLVFRAGLGHPEGLYLGLGFSF